MEKDNKHTVPNPSKRAFGAQVIDLAAHRAAREVKLPEGEPQASDSFTGHQLVSQPTRLTPEEHLRQQDITARLRDDRSPHFD